MVALHGGALGVADLVAAGRSVVLTGPAGIGKTHALEVAADTLRRGGVRVVEIRATAAMAAVPLGALIPLIAHRAGPLALTATALALVDLLVADRRTVLVVDDAHLLDGPSAGVLHQVVAAGVRVAASTREGERAPDAIDRIVTDLGARRLPVARLSETDTGAMLAEILGDAVDPGLVHAVQARAAGLPLAVAVLARRALAAGSVAHRGGSWRLTGALPVSAELGGLMADTTAALDAEAREVAELVAVADGLDEPALAALGAVTAAGRAEQAGVLAFDDRGAARLAHPLLLDALTAGLPVLRRRAHLARLLAVLPAPSTLLDRARHAEWSLALGRPVDAAELLRLAEATAPVLPDRAEAFLRAAALDAGPVARLRLAELLAHQHRADEARAELDALDLGDLDEQQAAAERLTRAFLLVFAIADPDAALAIVADLPPVPPVLAVRSSSRLYRGEVVAAAAEAEPLALDAGLPVEVRAHAALTRASALVYTGDSAAFAAWLPIARGLADAGRAAIPEGPEALLLLEALAALELSADPREAERLAIAGSRRALERADEGGRAQWDHLRAAAAMLAGDPAGTLPALRAAATARGRWTTNTRRLVSATLVRSSALAGEVEAAGEELGWLRLLPPLALVDPAVRLAEAELLACSGDRPAAVALATASARAGGGADAWYSALRFGAPAAEAFLTASAALIGPGREAQRDHARAVLTRDAPQLEAASAALEDAGLGLFAVDAMAHSAALALRQDPADRSPLERLRSAAARHPRLRSPLVAAVGRPALTAREAEIARSVAAGESARAIATALGIGVRTVETHVAHVYRKLGVTGRDELRAALRRS